MALSAALAAIIAFSILMRVLQICVGVSYATSRYKTFWLQRSCFTYRGKEHKYISADGAWEGAMTIPRHVGLEGTTCVTGLSHRLLTNTFHKLVKHRLLSDFLVVLAAAAPCLLKAWHKYRSNSVCLNIFVT